MVKLKLFTISLVVTICVLLTFIYINRPKQVALDDSQLKQVANGVFITSQLAPENVSYLRERGFKTIVDIRPDGEASDEAPASRIAQASRINGIRFDYIPVPHEKIPRHSVKELTDVLSSQPTPTILYCRTGRRAVRTFALAEASKKDGPKADDIIKMVHDAGFSADDLKENIDERIAQRNNTEEVKK